MTLNFSMPQEPELKPRITVFGVGGAGGNAVNNMIEKALEGVEFVVANTDAQALQQSHAANKVQMGVKATEGLGAGARPSVGAAAAEETIEEIVDHLAGAHMCFITAGMGGGTGTGAAPIIAQAARELGVLTVGVVTKPFQFEGNKRMRQAEDGVEALQKMVDTLIIIPNQNLFRLANEKTTFTEAFAMADDVLYQGVKGVTDLMVRPGLINLDFADVRAVMDEMGKAMMGTGESEGEDRARTAAEKAIANPLLDEISLNGAKGVLINITGGADLTLFELDEAANVIREKVDADANIIVGSTLDESLPGIMRVSVVATGIDATARSETPLPRRSMAQPMIQPPRAAEAPQPGPKPAPEPVAARAAAPEPRAAAPAPQPQPQPEPQRAEAAEYDASAGRNEPDFFADYDARRAAAEEQAEDVAEAMDDLPPPAYRPQETHAEAAAMAEPEDFVAPRAPAPGTPSPEALARLRAAVRKAPGESYDEQDAAASEGSAERPRFGINSLIGRMTGHGDAAPASAQRVPQPPRAVPPVAAAHAQPPRRSAQQPQSRAVAAEDEMSPEEERIEIPAFLRRQAN